MKLCLMILSVPWYMFNDLEHTAILSPFLTFITRSSSRVSTMHTTSYLTSLLQIYELKRRYETSHYTFLYMFTAVRNVPIQVRNDQVTKRPAPFQITAHLIFCRFNHVLVSGVSFPVQGISAISDMENIAISTLVGTLSHII